MKRRSVRMCFLAAIAFAALLPAACVVAPPPGTVYVSHAPPAAEVEITGVAPGPGYVWVPGYHAWRGGLYVWVPGSYQRAPHNGARWVSGEWHHHSKGWYWTDGRWK